MIAVVVLSAGIGLAFTACAASDETSPIPDSGTDATSLDDATSAEDASDARAVSPCDAGDPTCVAETVPCSEADWCPVEVPVKKTALLSAVWGSSSADVWTVGSGGTIAHWDGARWTATPSGTMHTLHGVWGAGANDVWVVSTSDVILHSTGFGNGGATWTLAQAVSRPNSTWELVLGCVWGPRGGSEILIGGASAQWSGSPLWGRERSSDAWTGYSGIPSGLTVRGIWGSSAEDLWIVGDIAGIPGEEGGGGSAFRGKTRGTDAATEAFVRTDIRALNRLEGVWGSAENDVWTVGTGGTIRHNSGGTRWEVVSSPTERDLHAVWGAGPKDVWAVGDKGTLLHWDGAQWKATLASLPPGPKPNFYGVWGSSPTDVWAVGERGTIIHFTGMKPRTEGEAP